ncbi:MAG: histidinol-phosphatase [Candidatus Latescibacteria bacterium]|nr:histidinol-phosphatase [Candidatus Latescibacterota bacterium]
MNLAAQVQRMIKTTALVLSVMLCYTAVTDCQLNARTEINIPDIGRYKTLKCDFHMHTVFSDGSVWPTVRAEEVWCEGLDALSITDHIEYLPHKSDMVIDFHRPYEIAKPVAESLNLIIIKGTEITRAEPMGHHNALFLSDVNLVDTPDSLDAIKAAAEQGAFIFWNHPGWKRPDGRAVWSPAQVEIFGNGWLHGIEVVNGFDYYPNAHAWCIEKKLTMMCSTDVHAPINQSYDLSGNNHRPMTLVFVQEVSEKGIKDALFKRRTAVYFKNTLIGEEEYLKPIFDESIEILTKNITINGKGRANIQIHNISDVSYELVMEQTGGETEQLITIPANITLYANKTVILPVRGVSVSLSGMKNIKMQYRVTNLLVAPDEYLQVEIPIKVTFVPVANN